MTASRWTMILVTAAWSSSAQAIGLGPLELDSALGQPLRARVPVFEAAPSEVAPSCLRAKIESLDGIPLTQARINLTTVGNRSLLNVVSVETINEPAIAIQVYLDCGTRVQRSYQVLLDFPSSTFAEAVLPATGTVKALSATSERRSSAGSTTSRPAALAESESHTTDATVRRSIASIAKRQPEQKIARSVLKLSADEPAFTGAMKLSDTLSWPNAPGQDAAPADDQTRIARSQFAAILRGENPALVAALEAEAARKKVKTLELEKVSLVRDKEASAAALQDISRRSYPDVWFAGLTGLLVFTLGTAGWLALRLRKTTRRGAEWWKTQNVVVDDAPLRPAAVKSVFVPDAYPKSDRLASAHPLTKEAARKEPVAAADGMPVPSQPKAESTVRELPPLEMAPRETQGFHDTLGTYADAGRHLNVEEVSDIVQEAEFWMLLNDPERALHLLEPHAEVERPDSPVTWLYLIDLYRQVGNREKYQELGQRFKRYFNARIPAWDEDPSGTERTSLEDFPGLLDRITGMWSDKGATVPFLESLLIDDRNGERIGFDLPVYKDIILLIGIANEVARVRTA